MNHVMQTDDLCSKKERIWDTFHTKVLIDWRVDQLGNQVDMGENFN